MTGDNLRGWYEQPLRIYTSINYNSFNRLCVSVLSYVVFFDSVAEEQA